MKKPTFSTYVLVAMIVLFATNGFSQVLRSFNKEYDASLKGDILVIGNNVLNRDFGTVGDRANDPYNATGGSSVYNESINMKWINIDPDGGNNFNSSRAKLTIPAASRSCYKIVYAALYWSGTYSIAADRGSASGADRSVINKVRFKVGTNPFVNLTGTVIYDYTGTGAPTIPQNVPTTAQGARNPYACMLDVTNYVQAGGEVNYTVANIASSEGGAGSSAGHSGGWSLFVVYEDPKLPGKYITSYNGFTRIRSGDPSFSFPIDGFRSIPVGPVKAKLAFAALEGDNRDASDFMEISGATIAGSVAERLSTPAIRPIVSGVPNFFNSSINDEDSYFTDRTPNSINTMGYDTGVLTLSNPGNNTIKNSETSANITLGTGADWYYLFFTALSIEIIEPDIILTKRVLNQAGNDIGGTNVTFNDILNYVIRFQNVGNDNAQNFTIEDTLPINVIFNYPADIISLPAGVTVRSYNAATRKLIFDIDNGLVEKNDPYREFRIRVQVVAGCNALNDACSNNIDNIAVANYTGTIDPDSNTVISINSNNQCLAEPKATNFLVGIDGCVYATNSTLCGNSLVLTAGNGYDKYAWSKSPFDSNGLPTGPIIGTGQSFTITDVGTYYVRNTAIAPCRSITQQFNVTRFGGVISNPLIPFADQVVICPDNGKQLPNIYLCGGNDSRTIRTGITGTDSIVWQRLSGGCATTTNPTCASEGSTCTWSTVGTGPDFTVNTAGEYRLVLNYAGGCFNLFYFNVYKNNFTPTATATDIYCNTPGRIVVTNPAQGTGYEYSLSPTGPFVATNTFTVTTAGIYTAYIRQVGVPTNPCVFDVKNLQVLNRTISVQEIVRQPLCFGDKGTVTLNINDVRGQYYLRFSKGTSTIVSPTPQSSNQFVINNLDVGSYNYTATTDDGCTQTGSITIVEPLILTATVALTKPLTCTAGEFVVTPVGGTAPYVFYVNGSTTFQSTLNPFSITTPLPPGGVFSIKVIDAKNCEATTSITVSPIPPPIYTMTQTNIKCYNDNIGVINFNVTNANGSTLAYSIDNGVTYLPTPTFSNLVAGTYNTIVRYTVGNEVCFAAAQPIVITQPSTALTASAGVSELAGCGPLGEGRIRITNPQGGTAPYEYSFDNQVSWTTINNAYKIPGTYTVYIRDANNCVYSMPNVIIDPKPVEPTIIVDDPMFNCDGTANSTVTVTNNGGVNYSYQYLLDGIPNTNVPPNVFRNVSSGTHTVSVAYTLQNVPTYSNLLNENFGYGEDTTSPGINTTFYCFERQVAATECKSSIRIDDGDYSVTSFIVEPFVPWVQPGDHTPQTVPPTPKGRSLVVNIGDQIATQDILYQKVINDIIPNQPINFEFFVMNLLETGNMQVDADLRIALLDASGTEISWFATGDIPKSEAWERYPKTPITLNPGNNSTLTFIIRSNKRATSGNDVAIDDIRVYQLPKTCITTKDFPFIIPTGKAFDAAIIGFKNVSCSGLNDGTITIAAQNFDLSKGFQYSINNGSTWITQLTSPYTITALAPATYTILMRADATATGACVITRSQIITAPAPLLASASVTAVSTCSTGATITASATGGTLAYRYELRDAGGVVIIRPYQLNPQFANISVGNYTVFVRDANNCIGSASTTINVVAVPTLTASLDSSSNLCLDNLNQGSLIVNVTGGTSPFTYSLNGGANQNSNTFNNLGAGTFNIVVTDSNNCTASISTIIIAPQLNVVANTTKILDCTPSPDAIITGTISGGAAPYTVTLLSGAGPGTIAQPSASTFTFTTATASVYQFRIQDAKGCIATATASINTLNSITATTAITNPTCNGALDGSVQIIPSGGVGPYTYSFNGSPFTGTSIYTNLIAGNSYPYEVRDSKNCLFTGTVILSEPTTLLTSAAATAFSCTPTNTKQSATITIAVPTTGTAPYQYSFNGSGYANVNSLTVNDNGTDQIITYSVKDAKGCIYTNTTTVLKLDAPTDLSFSASPVSCTNSTTTITATAANGVGTLTYSITFPLASAASNTTGVFAGLATGTYIFQVTDSNGCYYTESYIVNPVTPIVVTASKLTDVDCIGNSTGSLRYNVNGFGTTYSYSINGNPTVTGQTASSLSLLNLPAGTYNVIFTDETTACTALTSITITQPTDALSATIAQVNANCFVPTSQVTVTPLGGTTSYTYAFKQDGLAPIATDYAAANIANLNPATNNNWDVWIKDANGCTVKYDIVITTDSVLAVTATTLAQCLGVGSYTITATGSGGIGTLLYSINNGGSHQTGNTFVVATAGTYTIQVKDANGCTANSAPVVVAPQLTLTSVLNKGITCNPAPTAAQITLNVLGGTSPFTYESKEASGSYTAMASNVFNSSVAGSYTFRVTDSNGCTTVTTVPIVITVPVNPDITGVTQTQTIKCNGDDTAAITIAFDNTRGQSPFVFNIFNTTTSTNYGTQTSGLRAGNYTITITDANGCTDTFPTLINEPLPLAYTYLKNEIVCSGSGTTLGSIIATPNGGVAPYTYTITNNVGVTVNPPSISGGIYTFAIVNFGIYELSFVDANGCSYKQIITMASPPNDLIINVNNGAPSCTTSTIEVTVNPSVVGGPYHFALFPIISGSTPPYEYATNMASYQNANDNNILNPGYLQSTFTGLNPGVIYSFIVYDEATNCYYFKQAGSPTLTASTLTSTVSPNNVTCKGAADGTVDFTFTNTYPVATNVTYQIFNSQTNLPTSIPIGTVVGLNGTVTTPINGLGLLGTGTYYILFREVSSGANNGCTNASPIFTISESPVDLSIVASIIKNSNCNVDGIISGQAQGGTAPYTYQVTTSAIPPLVSDGNWVNTNTFSRPGLVAGTTYYIYTKDAYGCIKSDDIILFQDAGPVINSPAPICYDGSTPFTINLITDAGASASILPATYSINGSAFQTSPSFTFNGSGTYNLVIKDGNGCTTNVDYEVYPKLNIAATVTKKLDCTASPNATITLNATGGDTTPAANYTFEVSFNSGSFAPATNPYSAAIAGNYTFRVIDANNPTLCQATTTFTLDPISGTTITTTQTAVNCFGGADGSISVNVSLGAGPYEYQLNAGTFQSTNVFTGLTAGTTYVITVRDANLCLYPSAPITITQPLILTAISSITTPLSCGPGNAQQPATVTINGVGGTAPYQYSFDGGANYTTANTYQSYAGVTFDVFVKDAQGCLYTLINGVNITPLGGLNDLDFVAPAVTCSAPSTTVTVIIPTGQGGAAPFNFQNITSGTSNNTGVFAGLLPGTYLFQVTDANFCTYQESFTVNPAANITVSGQLISNITCNPGANGEVSFSVGNFSGNYTYTINGGTASPLQNNPSITVSGLTVAGTQTIVVTDVLTGCTATTSITVTQSAPLVLVANPFINGNCNFGSQVSVTASGGVAPYRYSYVPSGSPAGTFSTSASTVLDPAIATLWDVYVRDANNCIIATPLTISISNDALPSAITITGLSQCSSLSGTYSFTVNVGAGVGPFEYSIGSGFQTSPNFTVNTQGTYDISVKDANGCITTVPGLVAILPPLQLLPIVDPLPSCINNDGVVNVAATGGSGSYLFNIDGGAFALITSFTNVSSGGHILGVRDTTTLCEVFVSISLQTATSITNFNLSKTNVTCNGGNDGTIVATLGTPSAGVNDNPIYTYSIDGGITTQTSGVFSGLIAGIYTVRVTSGIGCVESQPIIVNQPDAITIPAPTVTQFGCDLSSNGINFAKITVQGVTGGSGVYVYEFLKSGVQVQLGASNVYTEANLLGGTYTVNVYDNKGCLGTVPSITIVPFITLDKMDVSIANAITCTNLEDIRVSITSIGGTPTNLRYTLVDLSGAIVFAPNTTGVFTGLNIGNYSITVENLDTGCNIQGIHYVDNPNTFDLTINNIVDATCFGGANGSANVTFVDRTITAINPDQAGPFSYAIVDSLGNSVRVGTTTNAGPVTINALAGGTYTITAILINSPFCSVTKNFTVNQPTSALAISETHSEITCVAGNNDGSITATATGGSPGSFEFELLNGTTPIQAFGLNSSWTGLIAGTYTINVRDSKGCVATVAVSLQLPSPIVITATPNTTMLNCKGDTNATITVSNPSGGQGSNYLYTLNKTSSTPIIVNGPQLSNVFTNLGAGTYTITVSDGWGCSATSSPPIIINEPTNITAGLAIATTPTCLVPATLELAVSGGTLPYSYSSSNSFTSPTIMTGSTAIIPVAPGTYRFYVRDANGCTTFVTNDIIIENLPALNLDINVINAKINCFGDTSGAINAIATGGLGNYVYTLLDGTGNTLPFVAAQSYPGEFTNLPAGNYTVRVTSQDCVFTALGIITISQPPAPLTQTISVVNVSCNGIGNGSITINATGGTGAIKYAISPNLDQFFDVGEFKDIKPGTYDVIAQDINGCYNYITGITITEPSILSAQIDINSVFPEICFGDNDGLFSIDITGGTAPYSISLDRRNGPYTAGTINQTRFDLTGLNEGEHTVYVRDANLCTTEVSIILPASVLLNPAATVEYGCVNNQISNRVEVTVDSSITNPLDVDYSLDNSGVFQASNVFIDITPGIHFIIARHTNGCEKKTADFEILTISPLKLELKNGGLNEIVATATGGSPEYRYTFNGEDYGTKNTFIYYKTGEYTVTVTDSNGCVAAATKFYEFVDVDIPNVFTPNGDGNNDGWLPTNTINYPDLIFHVFDRYGRKVGTFKEGESWDGKYNNQELPTGDYWYVLKLRNEKDAREYVGHFTLYR